MNPFVSTPEIAARVKAVAATWVGTAYAADGASKGSGCSCSALPWAILTEAGFDVPAPPPRGSTLKVDLLPMMRQWLFDHPTHFREVKVHEVAVGDILLFDLGIGHLSISIGNGEIVHSWQKGGAHVATLISSQTLRNLVGVWRPIIP